LELIGALALQIAFVQTVHKVMYEEQPCFYNPGTPPERFSIMMLLDLRGLQRILIASIAGDIADSGYFTPAASYEDLWVVLVQGGIIECANEKNRKMVQENLDEMFFVTEIKKDKQVIEKKRQKVLWIQHRWCRGKRLSFTTKCLCLLIRFPYVEHLPYEEAPPFGWFYQFTTIISGDMHWIAWSGFKDAMSSLIEAIYFTFEENSYQGDFIQILHEMIGDDQVEITKENRFDLLTSFTPWQTVMIVAEETANKLASFRITDFVMYRRVNTQEIIMMKLTTYGRRPS
jgi:hypothetical protein